MKKDIFLILIAILFIFILLYFYDKRETVLNKEYIENDIHVHIEYPYFHQEEIDSYLEEYLNDYIYQRKSPDSFLFIDYDYYLEDDERVELVMYFYEEHQNLVRESTKEFVIHLYSQEIRPVSSFSKKEKIEYDFYRQEFSSKNMPMVALTFDDGPNHNTVKVLDILEKYGVKATFFLLGCNIKGNEKIISRMNSLGMEIGNHMYSHKLLTKLSELKIQEEIESVDKLVFDIVGKKPTLIRPSYGAYNKKIQKILDRPIVIWNVDTLDWKYHNSKRIYKRVMKSISDGDIILMHDIYNATANSLELIIPELLKEGYQFVTVSELLYYKDKGSSAGKVYSNAN